jgi:cell division protein FtsB
MSSARSQASARAQPSTRRSSTARSEAAPRTARRPAPRRVVMPSSMRRVRWERLGRIALLVVLVAVVGLYAEHAVSYVSTHRAATVAKAQLDVAARTHHQLVREQQSLHDPVTIVRDARALGMIRPGEQSYAIIGHASR